MLRTLLTGDDLTIALRTSEGGEPTYDGYERQAVTWGPSVLVSGKVMMTNEAEVSFPRYPDNGEAIASWVLLDGEEVILEERLTVPRTPLRGDRVFFAAGELLVGV